MTLESRILSALSILGSANALQLYNHLYPDKGGNFISFQQCLHIMFREGLLSQPSLGVYEIVEKRDV